MALGVAWLSNFYYTHGRDTKYGRKKETNQQVL